LTRPVFSTVLFFPTFTAAAAAAFAAAYRPVALDLRHSRNAEARPDLHFFLYPPNDAASSPAPPLGNQQAVLFESVQPASPIQRAPHSARSCVSTWANKHSFTHPTPNPGADRAALPFILAGERAPQYFNRPLKSRYSSSPPISQQWAWYQYMDAVGRRRPVSPPRCHHRLLPHVGSSQACG
jgi:hypothetical protein